MSEIGDPITEEIEAMFAKQPHEGVWVRAVKPTPKRKPARALPRLRESLAEFPMYSLTSFELFFLGGDIGDCPSCKASWVDNVQQHSEDCEYTAWLDYMDRYEDDDRW